MSLTKIIKRMAVCAPILESGGAEDQKRARDRMRGYVSEVTEYLTSLCEQCGGIGAKPHRKMFGADGWFDLCEQCAGDCPPACPCQRDRVDVPRGQRPDSEGFKP